ncbi:acetolactate synthase 2 small subunit [Pseudaeromonas sp. ZJS20]|uniref:acetolactate synthase 2 small subunit n=1 Tax=Pseudaeromonas aegiceratis TaxID=3153928 RepID=UPI00390C7945
MKQHQFKILTQSRPEVMERVLRVVRHRGFALQGCQMESKNDSKQLQITLTVASERPAHLLFSQLDKLVDVTHVEARELAQSAAPQSLQIRA